MVESRSRAWAQVGEKLGKTKFSIMLFVLASPLSWANTKILYPSYFDLLYIL